MHEPVPVGTLSRDRVPPWLSAVIVRCLAKHPGRSLSQRARRARCAPRGPGRLPRRGAVLPTDHRSPVRSTRRPRQRSREAGCARRRGGAAGGRPSRRRWWRGRRGHRAARPPAGPTAARRAGGAQPAHRAHRGDARRHRGSLVGAGRQRADSGSAAGSRSRRTGRWCGRSRAADEMLGRGVEGTIVADAVEGETAGAGRRLVRRGDSFAPLVVNRTQRRLTVAVVGGRDTWTAAARSRRATRSGWATTRSAGAAGCGSPTPPAGSRAILRCSARGTA